MEVLWDLYFWPVLFIIAKILLIVFPLLFAVAYLTYVERKVIGAMQLRKGPNVVGPFGLFQPLADGLKLFLKETIIPSGADRAVFHIGSLGHLYAQFRGMGRHTFRQKFGFSQY